MERKLNAMIALTIFAGLLAGTANAEPPECVRAANYNTQADGVSFLVLKSGKVVCEVYSNGGEADQAHVLASGTKSFTGLMAAAAVQDGFLSLDERAAETITEWRDDPAKAKITIRQLLSLNSGLDPSETGAPPPYSVAIAQPMKHEAGTTFEYGPAAFQVFGALMKRKLTANGKPADPLVYLQTRIFDPIGVKPARWARTSEGDPTMPSGAALTAHDWAMVGEFVYHKGVVNGKAIIDQDVLSQLFVSSAPNPGYGVSWWLPGRPGLINSGGGPASAETTGGLPADIYMAAGAGNQRLYVIPSRQLTIVRQAEKAPRSERRAAARNRDVSEKWSDAAFLRLILADVK